MPEKNSPQEAPVQQKPRLVEPRVGQRAKILVPERKTESGKPIPVLRPGTHPRPYQTGEIVRWNDELVTLRQEGAVLATEIVE